MKEKLQEYALIAEIVSAACIVLSLIFVGLQVRQGAEETAANTAAVRGSVQQAMMEADKELLLFQAQAKYDQRLAQVEIENPTPLDALDHEFLYFSAYLRTRQHYWIQYDAGLLDYETYRSYMMPYVGGALGNNASARSVFLDSASNGALPEGFVEEIDRLWSEFFPDRQLGPD
jgi:hypothetical protein